MQRASRAMAAWLCVATLCAVAPAISGQTIGSPPVYPTIPSSPLTVNASYHRGSIEPLFNMTNYFLNVVQPRAWPKEIIGSDLTNIAQNLLNLIKEVLLYEVGFIVCGIIGILFIVLMPVVGFCFCVCRCCCLNCGGEMHQREKDNTPCRRHTFATLLAIVTIVMLAGIACAFATNEQTTALTQTLPKLVTDNLNDISTFIADISTQGNTILDGYNTFAAKVNQLLTSIDSSVGGTLQQEVYTQAKPLQEKALAMYEKMLNISGTLTNIDADQTSLINDANKLSADLAAEKQNLTVSLNQCGSPCGNLSAKLSNLTVSGNFSNMGTLSDQIASVNSSLKTNIPELVQKGNNSIFDIPARVKNETRIPVKNAQAELTKINGTISGIRADIFNKILSSNITDTIRSINTTIGPVLNKLPDYEHYVWIAGVVLCCMILFVCLLNILGLLFGTCGYNSDDGPTDRGCASNCGGSFLMASVGLSFIFSWLLMILVTILFIVFGNAQKLLCEPLGSKDLLKFVDTMTYTGVPAGNGSIILRILYMNGSVSTLDVYNGCASNNGIFSVLQLDTQYNLDDYLNYSKYEAQIDNPLANISFTLDTVQLLDATAQESLKNFSNNGLNSINFTTFFAELEKGLVPMNLTQFASDLRNVSNSSAINDSANNLERIDREQVVPLQQKLDKFKQNIQDLQNEGNITQIAVNALITDLNAFQANLPGNASQLVKSAVDNLLTSVKSQLQVYINWTKNVIVNKLAPCKPLSNLIDSLELIGCKYLVNSMNSFWFGLGWATIFLLPSVIFAVKLAKFYRRMDTEDTYSEQLFPSPKKIPRPKTGHNGNKFA